MWAEHDVFGASLPPRYHLQPQHLPWILILAYLLPPRGESTTAICPTSELPLFQIWTLERHLIYKALTMFVLCVLQTCSNEVKCICDPDYTGKDCSVFDPIPTPTSPDGPEKYKGNLTEQFSPFIRQTPHRQLH